MLPSTGTWPRQAVVGSRNRPPMTIVRPSLIITLLVTSVVCLRHARGIDGAGGIFGMDFHADVAVIADEGAEDQLGADVEELHGLLWWWSGWWWWSGSRAFWPMSTSPCCLLRARILGLATTVVSVTDSRARTNTLTWFDRKPIDRPPGGTALAKLVPKLAWLSADGQQGAGELARRGHAAWNLCRRGPPVVPPVLPLELEELVSGLMMLPIPAKSRPDRLTRSMPSALLSLSEVSRIVASTSTCSGRTSSCLQAVLHIQRGSRDSH